MQMYYSVNKSFNENYKFTSWKQKGYVSKINTTSENVMILNITVYIFKFVCSVISHLKYFYYLFKNQRRFNTLAFKSF